MGLLIDRVHFDEADHERFAHRLGQNLTAFARLLERPDFGEGAASVGGEVELSIVGDDSHALPLNRTLLAASLDSHLQLELDRFNIEYNLTPVPLAGRPFSALEEETKLALVRLDKCAQPHGGRVVAIGILPTLSLEDLQSSAMTDLPRYRALSAGIRRMRRGSVDVDIDGDEPLCVPCDDVTLEGANTSFQVHLRVRPADFATMYNALQMATPIAVAVSANSPLFLGHRLWSETRLALFKQAVEVRAPQARATHQPARVCFGYGWVRHGALELFEEAVALYPPLLPVSGDEDLDASLDNGSVPELHELRLHSGTVWRWNRPIYDPSDGGHLRIELRALPSGPTPRDMAASAAFLIGLAKGLSRGLERMLPAFPFRYAEQNFLQAARYGLDARLLWPYSTPPSPQDATARELAMVLLSTAEKGLIELGVEAEEAASFIEVIHARLAARTTGADWQLRMLERLEQRYKRPEALEAMLEAYIREAKRGNPVHEWSDEP